MTKESEFKLDVVSVRLVKDAPLYSEHSLETPEDAVDLLGEHMCQMDREVVCVLNLNTKNIPINVHFVSVGTLNYAMTHPREIMKASILSNAAAILLMHNHPSGIVAPSKADELLTRKIDSVCKLMEIPLLDHIIVGDNNREYFSFKKENLLNKPLSLAYENYHIMKLASSSVKEKERTR